MQDSLVSRSSTSTYINGSATLIVGAVSLKRVPGPHILTMSLRAASMPRLDNTCASAVRRAVDLDTGVTLGTTNSDVSWTGGPASRKGVALCSSASSADPILGFERIS